MEKSGLSFAAPSPPRSLYIHTQWTIHRFHIFFSSLLALCYDSPAEGAAYGERARACASERASECASECERAREREGERESERERGRASKRERERERASEREREKGGEAGRRRRGMTTSYRMCTTNCGRGPQSSYKVFEKRKWSTKSYEALFALEI